MDRKEIVEIMREVQGPTNDKVCEMHKIITGGGEPSKGLTVRVDRLEQARKRGARFQWTIVAATIGAGIAWLKQKTGVF